jgi:hypothetical protein
MPDSTDPSRGRRRLADRDREADAGERREEYRRGEWSKPGDPADRRRAEAVEGETEKPRRDTGDP